MKETVDSVTKFTVAWPLVSNISVDLTPTLFLEMFIFFYIFPDLSLIASSRFSI